MEEDGVLPFAVPASPRTTEGLATRRKVPLNSAAERAQGGEARVRAKTDASISSNSSSPACYRINSAALVDITPFASDTIATDPAAVIKLRRDLLMAEGRVLLAVLCDEERQAKRA